MAFDVYEEITSRIIAELEKGEIPWKKPWVGGTKCAYSHKSGKPYGIVNQMLLMGQGEYITFLEAKKEGGTIKRGEHGQKIMSWAKIKQTVQLEDGREREELLILPKLYTVFEISQCEGIERKCAIEDADYVHEPVKEAESVIKTYFDREKVSLEIVKGSGRAFYSPSDDKVVLPDMSQFEDVNEFYSTAFHEMTHSTGHPIRLNRLTTGAKAAFGGSEYSKEELTAELGAAALCNRTGIETKSTFINSTAYIQNWLSALKKDKKLLVGASARAEKAIAYITTGTANAY